MSARDLPDLNLVVTEMELQFDRLIEQRAHDRKVIAELLVAARLGLELASHVVQDAYGTSDAAWVTAHVETIKRAIALAEGR